MSDLLINLDELGVAVIEQGLKDLKLIQRRLKELKKNPSKRNKQFTCIGRTCIGIEEVENLYNTTLRELESDWCGSMVTCDINDLIKAVLNDDKKVFKTDRKA